MCLLGLTVLVACDDQYNSGGNRSSPSPVGTSTDSRAPASTFASELTPARVTHIVDGDTIGVDIGGAEYTVRYIGIDTPETVDPRRPAGCFGEEATSRNEELVRGQTVGLEKDLSEIDEFGRLLRYVWIIGEGEEPKMVNALLLEEGYAQTVTFPPDVRYADRFASLQREAREAGRGLWGPICETPVPTAIPTGGNGACEFSDSAESMIKGNISVSSGQKIYHVPGGEFYDQTVIDESKGERWFCTEQEAIDAGWRRSRA